MGTRHQGTRYLPQCLCEAWRARHDHLRLGFGKRDVLPGSEELAQVWRPYLETCIEAFGVHRGMLESNFPVDGASCSYQALWNAFKRVTKGATAAEKAALYRNTARQFYSLDN